MTPAQNIIQGLVDSAQLVDEGSFTLDSKKALAKLRQFQLADPIEFVLFFIEAAWWLNKDTSSAQVHFRTSSTSLTVDLCGVRLNSRSLPHLFSAPLGKGKHLNHQVLSLLGQAANAALALNPARLVLTSDGGRSPYDRIFIDSSGEISEPQMVSIPNDQPKDSVRFEFEGKLLSSLWIREIPNLLRERCRYTEFPVIVNGERVSFGKSALMIDQTIQRVGIPWEYVGVAGRTVRSSREPAQLVWVNRGVAFMEPMNASPGFQAVVTVDETLDASRKKLVENERLDEIRAAARRAIDDVTPAGELLGYLVSEPEDPEDKEPGFLFKLTTIFVILVGLVGFLGYMGLFRTPKSSDENPHFEIRKGQKIWNVQPLNTSDISQACNWKSATERLSGACEAE